MDYTYHFINLSHKHSHFWILFQKIFCFILSLTLRITEQTAKAIVLENNPNASLTSLSLPYIFRDIDFNNYLRKNLGNFCPQKGLLSYLWSFCMHFPNCLPIPHSHTVIINIISSNLAVKLDSCFSFTPKSHRLLNLVLMVEMHPHPQQTSPWLCSHATGDWDMFWETCQKKCEESHFPFWKTHYDFCESGIKMFMCWEWLGNLVPLHYQGTEWDHCCFGSHPGEGINCANVTGTQAGAGSPGSRIWHAWLSVQGLTIMSLGKIISPFYFLVFGHRKKVRHH